jgi:hypothetical protein
MQVSTITAAPAEELGPEPPPVRFAASSHVFLPLRGGDSMLGNSRARQDIAECLGHVLPN